MKEILSLLFGMLSASSVLAAATVDSTPTTSHADHGTYYEIHCAGSHQPGALIYDSVFTLWIPDGVEKIRGILVHQHGCGINPTKYGHMIAYDLQWQSLARKWGCAILGPSFVMTKADDECFKWCDPRNGSDQVFLHALDHLSAASKHAELARAPWALWGHSGGGSWVSIMQMLHPERVIAVWFRSGSAYPHWTDGRIPKVEIPAAAMEIPMMCSCGAKEEHDPVYHDGWKNPMLTFQAYRAAGAPVGFAPDPLTVHGCGDSRYLAIPFFDACLELRLPDLGSDPTRLKPIKVSDGWLAPLLGNKAVATAEFKGDVKQSVWLPNARVAQAWSEFVQTGGANDTTPPPAPTHLETKMSDAGVTLTWEADADLESGLQQFIIERDGQEIGRLPEKPVGRFGRPLYQSMSGWDTPNAQAAPMVFVDKTPGADAHGKYRVVAVNSVGLRSP